MTPFLTIVAWWVVVGLPVVMGWRIITLVRTTGKPPLFYVGSWLIIVGVLMWVPFCLLKRLLGLDVPVWPFLTLHLLGVIPGAYLKRQARTQHAGHA